MRKIALFVALAMIAASPAMAQQKKSKRTAEPAMTPEQQHFDNSYRLVRDGLPMWLPSWAQFIYQTGVKPGMEAEQPKPAKKKSKKKS
jgi:hypothetical protein